MSLISRFGEPVAKLTWDQRVQFYEILARELTVEIRSVWTDSRLSAEEMVDQIKWINEILHRVVTKISYARTHDDRWRDTDFQAMVEHWVRQNPRTAPLVNHAINASYKYAVGDF